MKTSRIFLLSLISAAFIFTACTDDSLTNNGGDDFVAQKGKVAEGEDIFFSVTQNGFEDTNGSASTRTMYGDIITETENGVTSSYIPIYWGTKNSKGDVEPDTIYIRSTGCQAGARWGEYNITSYDENNNIISNGTHGKVTHIPTHGDWGGMKWGNTTQVHKFTSIYPASRITNYKHFNDAITSDNDIVEITLPTAQEHRGIELKNGTWVVSPDMKNAVMYGSGEWDAQEKNDTTVNLKYKPLSACLDVTINGFSTENDAYPNMPVTAVTLRANSSTGAKSRINIVGPMTVNMDQGTMTNANSTKDYSFVTVSCMRSSTLPTEVGIGQKLNVRFFLAIGNGDDEKISTDDLTLQVLLKNNKMLSVNLGKLQTKNKTNKYIEHGKYYTITVPADEAPQQGSSDWEKGIDDDVLFSQLSLPGTRHSYSYLYNSDDSNLTDLTTSYMQSYQSLNIANQIKAGIRVFHAQIHYAPSTYDASQPANICLGSGARDETLEQFLTTLYENRPMSGSKPTDGMVLLLEWIQPGATVDYNQVAAWNTKIEAVINNFQSTHTDFFISGFSPSTTVGQMRGRVAVIKLLPSEAGAGNGTYTIALNGYDTSVKNQYVKTYTAGDFKIYGQNLHQCNNPEFTAQTDTKIEDSQSDAGGVASTQNGINVWLNNRYYNHTNGWYARACNYNSSKFYNSKGSIPYERAFGIVKLTSTKYTKYSSYSELGLTDGRYTLYVNPRWAPTSKYSDGESEEDMIAGCIPLVDTNAGIIPTYKVGLVPAFATQSGYKHDQMSKKVDLIKEILNQSGLGVDKSIWSLNDLSGFSVVNKSESLGYWRYFLWKAYNETYISWARNKDKDDMYLVDIYQADKLPSNWYKVSTLVGEKAADPYHNLHAYNGKNRWDTTTEGVNWDDKKATYAAAYLTGDENLGAYNVCPKSPYDALFWGRGGNTAIFAEVLNKYITDMIFDATTDQQMKPFGMVLMNFAGAATYAPGNPSKEYNVYGVALPNMIVYHNFRYPLPTKSE